MADRSHMNIELSGAGVGIDIDLLVVHKLSYLCFAIRARGPHDYSSYA